ncbi:MAG TPA: GNAT family N-acetyltransferase [Victivallales bacterium]|nr:GNAT family N-acetyltransferase [Victivallales bacterium]
MNIQIKIGQTPELILESRKIRKEVFFKEQKIPLKLDSDGLDDNSYLAVAYANNQVVGTARLALTGHRKALLARVAVKKEFRGYGIASKMVNELLLQAEKLNINTVDIHPHEYLKDFYENFGFIYIEQSKIVGNHQLIRMKKKIIK